MHKIAVGIVAFGRRWCHVVQLRGGRDVIRPRLVVFCRRCQSWNQVISMNLGRLHMRICLEHVSFSNSSQICLSTALISYFPREKGHVTRCSYGSTSCNRMYRPIIEYLDIHDLLELGQLPSTLRYA
jgi:hypothetical protein